MTISARAAMVSCLLVLSAGIGSAQAYWGWGVHPGPGGVHGTPAVRPADLTSCRHGFARSWHSIGRVDCEPAVYGDAGWTVEVDALLLKRSEARPQDLLFSPLPVLNVADLGFDFEAGPRVELTYDLDRDHALQVGYFGISTWTSSAVRDGAPLILFPPGLTASSRFSVDYGSDLYSTEVSLRHRWCDYLDLLGGFRWVELHEGFEVAGASTPPTAAIPRYTTQASNYLYGFQFGTDIRVLDRGGVLRVDGFIKAGAYGNHAQQETFSIHNLGIIRTAGDQRDHVTFLGEVGLTGVFRLNNHLAVRGGYQAMWIEGVALAPDQIPSTDVTPLGSGLATLDTSGNLFFHGWHVGLEARW